MSTTVREEIVVGQIVIRFLLEGAESGGAVAAFEFDVPAGAKVPIGHTHDAYEETVYGLEGTLTWTLAGTPTEVGAGDVLHIPRGVVHHFDNAGTVDARALAIVTPGILGPGYFHEAAAVLAAAAGGPPDVAAMVEVMRTGHVGVEYVEYVLRHKRKLEPAFTPLELGNPALDGITLREPDLTLYDPPTMTRDPGDAP